MTTIIKINHDESFTPEYIRDEIQSALEFAPSAESVNGITVEIISDIPNQDEDHYSKPLGG